MFSRRLNGMYAFNHLNGCYSFAEMRIYTIHRKNVSKLDRYSWSFLLSENRERKLQWACKAFVYSVDACHHICWNNMSFNYYLTGIFEMNMNYEWTSTKLANVLFLFFFFFSFVAFCLPVKIFTCIICNVYAIVYTCTSRRLRYPYQY